MKLHPSPSDPPLAQLTPLDVLDLKSLSAHVLATGASGSGKTTGSGEVLAGACLQAGMGMLVCCLKPDESDLWVKRCQRYGRRGSLMRWSGSNYRFNFIAHCLARFGAAGIGSVVEFLMTILEVVRQAGASPGRNGDQFWTDSVRTWLRHCVPLVYAATGTVRIADVLQFIQSAPQSVDQMKDAEWQRGSFFFKTCLAAVGRIDEADGQRCAFFWRDVVATLDAKTRSNIAITLTTALDRFNHGWLRETFTTDCTIVPELCFHGALIVMDMPPTVLGEDGLIAQLLFKHCWQQAMLARNGLEPQHRERYCALFADECQAFVTPRGDADFLAVCRSSRVCVIYLTQSLAALYAKIGGDHPQDATHHLISNFGTKIWHATSCTTSQEWASKTIGRQLHRRSSFNQGEGTSRTHGLGMGEGSNWGTNSGSSNGYTSGPNGGSSTSSSNSGSSQGGNDSRNRNRGSGSSENTSWGYSEQMDYIVEPAFFGWGLKTGGAEGIVTSVWYQAGRTFAATGANHFLATFRQ